ncbi:MAG: hypothetical protein JXR70_11275 [Spirochaetales bacterium]|nr:hypothetical protein [Spirochaetales bacterium]
MTLSFVKKVVILILLEVCLLSHICFAQELGDVNFDASVNIVDALLVAQNYVNIEPVVFYENAADVNCSGRPDIVDALLIAQYYVNLLERFPCEGMTAVPEKTPHPLCEALTEAPLSGIFQVLRPEKSSTLYTSEHFAARWNPADNVPLTAAQVQSGLNGLEKIWDFYINDLGFQEPYFDSLVKYKVSINISDQGWATGAGTGQKDPEMWVHYNAFKDTAVLAHEFTHTLQFSTQGMRDSRFVGWFWESHAEWMRHQYFPDQVNCAEALVNAPHLYYGSTRDRYCNWQFWEYLKDCYCYKVVNDMWTKAPKPGEAGYDKIDPFTVLMENMGWSLEELNDTFGDWAMKNALWDYNNGDVYARAFGSYDERNALRHNRVTQLEALDMNLRRFVVPSYWAPQRWGYNLVKLLPDNPGEDSQIRLSFKGVMQNQSNAASFGSYALEPSRPANPDSGWRWGLAARDSAGKRRYSPLQGSVQGEIEFDVKADDRELWLVVLGAPVQKHQIFWDQIYYTIYRYPWMVQLDGAWPEGFHPAEVPPGSGHYHPNGDGWVANTASVDSTVYVGPHARVLGNARVSGNARIEDWAEVSGNARVRDNAVIQDHALVSAGEVYENARIGALSIMNNGTTRVHGSAYVASVINALPGVEISGTAQLLGDMELSVAVSKGVYYGLVDAATSVDPAYGANRTSPMTEVTRPGPYWW